MGRVNHECGVQAGRVRVEKGVQTDRSGIVKKKKCRGICKQKLDGCGQCEIKEKMKVICKDLVVQTYALSVHDGSSAQVNNGIDHGHALICSDSQVLASVSMKSSCPVVPQESDRNQDENPGQLIILDVPMGEQVLNISGSKLENAQVSPGKKELGSDAKCESDGFETEKIERTDVTFLRNADEEL
eukprot:CAMPEP_0182445326 /NCGR_PEP_ID=MMETSP1172-20130603/3491_1 /TAXON_ID=708627 /ORGANISM="Timspurckia oligopyrenoides, Strain CCMP3278" /LENGTH=185 /DNA_ID=CAMNT_0024641075 /DNA_START=174 /DNA_END=728 /DNA_ORIENTATION=+